MTVALHRWNRETLLARLRASEAIDEASAVDAGAAARQRLHLLTLGDSFEAGAMPWDEVVIRCGEIEARAREIAGVAVSSR
jgi:hypothetical protein